MASEGEQDQRSYQGELETALEALRKQEVDAVVGENQVLMLRLHEVEKELRTSEGRLRELNNSLEQRIAERTSELKQQTERLRHLANELTETEQRERKQLARLLHDGLQQLLIAVQVNLEILSSDYQSPELVQTRELVQEAIQTSRTLAYEIAPPALYESTFSEALNWLANLYKERYRLTVTLSIADDMPALAEHAKVFLFNAVQELLLNIVKHAGVQEAVVRCMKVDEVWWKIEVQDDGRGFDPAYLQNAAEIEKGFGLLSIRERLLALGGSLEITSEPGAGSQFVIKFPVKIAEADTQPEDQEFVETKDGGSEIVGKRDNLHILVVDDHRMVREGLTAMLQRQAGFKVVGEAGNGIIAVDLVDELRPDVVVMDISMPEMDGIEATQRIKARYPEVRIVGLSLHEEGKKSKAMLRAGASAFLQKEAASKALIELIKSL